MENKGIRVIITGSTGMVGEGVLLVCLQDPAVEKVLVINRRPLGITHPKLTEIIHTDFYDLSAVETQLAGYDACFFCLGVSSVAVKGDEYYRITYTLTMHFGETVSRLNRGMVFVYVAGAGTDGTEKGRIKWARIMGKTENDLMKLPFRRAYGYRPGMIKPVKGQKNALSFYKYVNWIFPLGKKISPDYFSTMEELGLSMIRLVQADYPKNIIAGRDIALLAAEQMKAEAEN